MTDGTSDINSFEYSYNQNSQITERTVPGSGEESHFSESYTYDDLGRLTERERGKGLGLGGEVIEHHECFTLDRSGNVMDYYDTTTSSCTGAVELEHNTSNEITEVDSVAYDYSDSGALTDRGTTTDQTFDAWGNLTEVEVDSSVIASYEYNGLGQKVKRSDSPVQEDTEYHYSAAGQLLEAARESDGVKIQTFVWGTQGPGDIVETIGAAADSEEYYVLDAKGNVTTRLDDSGEVAARHIYSAFGTPSQLSADYLTFETIGEDLHLFSAEQYHVDQGQYDTGEVWLDAELASYTTRAGGSSSPGGNTYSVAAGDPVNAADLGPQDLRDLLNGFATSSGQGSVNGGDVGVGALANLDLEAAGSGQVVAVAPALWVVPPLCLLFGGCSGSQTGKCCCPKAILITDEEETGDRNSTTGYSFKIEVFTSSRTWNKTTTGDCTYSRVEWHNKKLALNPTPKTYVEMNKPLWTIPPDSSETDSDSVSIENYSWLHSYFTFTVTGTPGCPCSVMTIIERYTLDLNKGKQPVFRHGHWRDNNNRIRPGLESSPVAIRPQEAPE